MNYYLTLGLDWVAVILTVVLVLASIVFLGVICFPRMRKRLGFAEDFKKVLVWPLMIGVVSIVVTHTFAKAISESETRAKYVELGVGILSSIQPKNASNERTRTCPELSIDERALRKWAVGIVRAYSDVPMDPLVEERLICVGVDKAILEQLGLKLPQPTIDKLQDLGIFPSEVLLEP